MGSEDYTIAIEDRGNYLYVCVEADKINFSIMVEYINQYARALRETGHDRMLFVRRTPILQDLEWYSTSIQIAKNMVPAGTRVAVIDLPENKAGAAKILEKATSQGLESRSFANIKDAEEWLCASATKPPA